MSNPLIIELPHCPDLAACTTHAPDSFPLLLQSSAHEGWDIALALPESAHIYSAAQLPQFLADFDQLPTFQPQTRLDTLPFYGGWGFFLAYEVLHGFEPHVPPTHHEHFPIAALWRCPAAVLIHRPTQRAFLVAETAAQQQHLQRILDRITASVQPPPQALTLLHCYEESPQQFLDGVEKIREYIRQGDVFQVNLSREWRAELSSSIRASDIFAALRHANPAPFSALCQFDADRAIISSSPERLVRLNPSGIIETRPIAGTHPRSPNPEHDAALKAQLIASRKERAEHIMLIDLERNDLGRICQSGSIEVNELMTIASYTHVHHLESNVRGLIQNGLSPRDIFRALFPGGTITGCPKVRCMQIIHELERTPRGAYTGSLGYLNHDGTLDSNILIRTFTKQNNQLTFRAGAGIVADSHPERELAETRHKARGLLRALGIAPTET